MNYVKNEIKDFLAYHQTVPENFRLTLYCGSVVAALLLLWQTNTTLAIVLSTIAFFFLFTETLIWCIGKREQYTRARRRSILTRRWTKLNCDLHRIKLPYKRQLWSSKISSLRSELEKLKVAQVALSSEQRLVQQTLTSLIDSRKSCYGSTLIQQDGSVLPPLGVDYSSLEERAAALLLKEIRKNTPDEN